MTTETQTEARGISATFSGMLPRPPEYRPRATDVSLIFFVCVDDARRAEYERAVWVRVICRGELARRLRDWLLEGMAVRVAGRLEHVRYSPLGGRGEKCSLTLHCISVQRTA